MKTNTEIAVHSERMTFGACKRCLANDAFYYPTHLCDDCHKEFSQIAKYFEPGSEARRQAVNLFFENKEWRIIIK